jgi:transcriptional regulator with XRE-family HTH domain
MHNLTHTAKGQAKNDLIGGIMDPNDVGSRLGMLIKAMKLKQYQFTEKFGISANSLDRYKNNERFPDPQIMARLIDAGVNVNWRLRGEGSMFILAPWELGDDIRTTKKVQIVDGKPVLVNDFDTTYVRTSIFPIVADIAAGSPLEVPEVLSQRNQSKTPLAIFPSVRTATWPSESMVIAWSLRYCMVMLC